MKEIKQNSNESHRSLILDSLRGFTVILMIIFHFSFDLNYFGLVTFDIIHHPFWYFFPRLIVFLFLFCTGTSLYLSHTKGIKWKAFNQRLALLLFWALSISLMTYLFFPANWIYFGTLHAILVTSIFSLPFLNKPKISLIIALILFTPSILFDVTIPWFQLPHSSWDYISPFPWLGANLLGIFAAHKNIHLIQIPANRLVKSLNFLGRHSLFIYLIHQPILFGCLMMIMKVIRS